MDIKYGVESFFGKTVVWLNDSIFSHAWYLKGISKKGEYRWTRDPLYARQFSIKTALKHKNNLENGADKDWECYHNHWETYYREIGIIEGRNSK